MMPKSKPPHRLDIPPLPESLVGTFKEVYNDSKDVTSGQGDIVGLVKYDDRPEGSKIDTRADRKKCIASSIITPMQEAFIAYYVATRDKVKSAEEAGYNPNCVHAMSKRLLNPVYYPLVANRIKELLKKQQEMAVMDGADVLRYVHTVMQFSPADWFIPGSDGGWLMDMDDVRVLPSEIKALIEHIEMKTIEGVDGTITNKMWVRFVSKTQALAIAARYQLGDLNKDTTPVVQIDWTKLFGRGPVTLTQTTTQVSVSPSNSRSKALSTSASKASSAEDSSVLIFLPEDTHEEDEVERKIQLVEAITTPKPKTVTEKVKEIAAETSKVASKLQATLKVKK